MALDKREPGVKAIEAISSVMFQNMKHMADHPIGKQMQAEVTRLRDAADALGRVKATRSPLDTPAAHALKVAKLARQFDEQAHAMIKRTSALVRQGDADVQRRVAEKVKLVPDDFASEIRTAFRSMDAKAQAELVKKLVDENRGPEMAAIVQAPSILTGITDQERASYEKMILEKHAGAEIEEGRNLEEIYDATYHAWVAARGMVKSYTDPGELAAIERAAAEADAAGEAFDQSMQ